MSESLSKIKMNHFEVDLSADVIAYCDLCNNGICSNGQIKVLNIEVYAHDSTTSFDICPNCLRKLADQIEKWNPDDWKESA